VPGSLQSAAMGVVSTPKDVLVVDDERSLRLLCRVNLELDGHVVREAATLAEARRELDEHPPDVLLLDLHVGAEDGLDLLDDVEAQELPLRIVLLSGTADVGPQVRARVEAVLGKPFELDRLSAAVAGCAVR
jgi:DNA-binding NtrC family response regulator